MILYDSLIIGSGPAGLSAAIYLSRFNRNILCIDKGYGRSTTHEINENYLGFPNGIPGQTLRALGRQQAERFGAHFVDDYIAKIVHQDGIFILEGKASLYHGKSLILCMGVTDLFPQLPHIDNYVGKSLFWCITCDGHKTIDKNIIVIGFDDDAACNAMQFLTYTSKITLVTNCLEGEQSINPILLKRLKNANIPIIEGIISSIEGENGMVSHINLENGKVLKTEVIINELGAVPNSQFAKELGVDVNENGYIKITEEQRTNIPFIYAAGDITDHFSHQVGTAVHEGSMAAQAANYDLYPEELKSL